jgi:hypothetical protein
MNLRLPIGVAAVLLLAVPARVSAQRGAAGGFAAPAPGVHFSSAPSGGAPHPASGVHTSSSVPSAVTVASSSARTHASIHGTDVPSRHAGFASSAPRGQNTASKVFAPIGRPLPPRRNPPPVTTQPGTAPRVAYLLGVGGYYYAAPGDAALDQPQEEAQQEGQEQDDQQAGAEDERGREQRAENRDEARGEVIVAAPAAQQQQADEQEPLPDVGTLTLVLRDGARLNVVAFTMTQGQVIYITPEGLRLTISAEILDADATQRVNQEHGTPMQLPL